MHSTPAHLCAHVCVYVCLQESTKIDHENARNFNWANVKNQKTHNKIVDKRAPSAIELTNSNLVGNKWVHNMNQLKAIGYKLW